MGDYTYTNGYKLFAKRDITKSDFIQFCNRLNNLDRYKDVCRFEPEAISEGGVVFKFHNNDKEYYKTIRLWQRSVNTVEAYKFRIDYGLKNYKSAKQWPWINENVMEEWKDSNDILFNSGVEIWTFLKAFHGAPVFTKDELINFEIIFDKLGFYRKGQYPSKSRLKEFGELGKTIK